MPRHSRPRSASRSREPASWKDCSRTELPERGVGPMGRPRADSRRALGSGLLPGNLRDHGQSVARRFRTRRTKRSPVALHSSRPTQPRRGSSYGTARRVACPAGRPRGTCSRHPTDRRGSCACYEAQRRWPRASPRAGASEAVLGLGGENCSSASSEREPAYLERAGRLVHPIDCRGLAQPRDEFAHPVLERDRGS